MNIYKEGFLCNIRRDVHLKKYGVVVHELLFFFSEWTMKLSIFYKMGYTTLSKVQSQRTAQSTWNFTYERGK